MKAHRLLHHSTLGLRAIKKKKKTSHVLSRVDLTLNPTPVNLHPSPAGEIASLKCAAAEQGAELRPTP